MLSTLIQILSWALETTTISMMRRQPYAPFSGLWVSLRSMPRIFASRSKFFPRKAGVGFWESYKTTTFEFWLRNRKSRPPNCSYSSEMNRFWNQGMERQTKINSMSSLLAFYVACDDHVPKPVTSVSIASLLVGDVAVQQAFEQLERRGWIRDLRDLVRFASKGSGWCSGPPPSSLYMVQHGWNASSSSTWTRIQIMSCLKGNTFSDACEWWWWKRNPWHSAKNPSFLPYIRQRFESILGMAPASSLVQSIYDVWNEIRWLCKHYPWMNVTGQRTMWVTTLLPNFEESVFHNYW